jgi:hypothetical protein
LRADPNLMNAAGLNVNSLPNAIRLFHGVVFLGVCNRQLSVKNQMCRETTVRMGAVVGISVAASHVSLVHFLPSGDEAGFETRGRGKGDHLRAVRPGEHG